MTRIFTLSLLAACLTLPNAGATWKRHTIDGPDITAGKSGADGVRLADANDDGLLDITTGWEEGGAVRVYLNPGPEQAKFPWPAVTVGLAKSVEDAVFADLDNDGQLDVVSATEGKNRTVYVHWAPDQSRYLDPKAWITQAIPATAGLQMWMFALPMNVDGENGIDLILGSKGTGATVSWLCSPDDPRNVNAWTLRKITGASWIMSIRPFGNGFVYSDRKGDKPGIFSISPPKDIGNTPFPLPRRLAPPSHEYMFLDLLHPRDERYLSIVVATKDGGVLALDPPASLGTTPAIHEMALPKNAGTGKAARVARINQDPHNDLVLTCENANGNLSGVWWHNGSRWLDISGPEGIKYDRIELLDLDADGDLDLITCEERANLGVIWFENPTR